MARRAAQKSHENAGCRLTAARTFVNAECILERAWSHVAIPRGDHLTLPGNMPYNWRKADAPLS